MTSYSYLHKGMIVPKSEQLKDYLVARKRSTISGSIGSTASV
jgi:hypothetical protein